LDTGAFDDNRYFDIFIEYAKATPEDLCIRIEAVNRGPEAASLHLIPHLWFRNTWAWGPVRANEPAIRLGRVASSFLCLSSDDSRLETISAIPVDYHLGLRTLFAPLGCTALFTDNETNHARVHGSANFRPFVKDAFHRFIIDGEPCVNPQQFGTKAALH